MMIINLYIAYSFYFQSVVWSKKCVFLTTAQVCYLNSNIQAMEEVTNHQPNFVFEEQGSQNLDQELSIDLPSPVPQQNTAHPPISHKYQTFELPDYEQNSQGQSQLSYQTPKQSGVRKISRKFKEPINELSLDKSEDDVSENAVERKINMEKGENSASEKFSQITPDDGHEVTKALKAKKQSEDKFMAKNITKGMFQEDPTQKQDQQYTKVPSKRANLPKVQALKPTKDIRQSQKIDQSAQMRQSTGVRQSNGLPLRKTLTKLPPIVKKESKPEDNSPTKTQNSGLLVGNESSMLTLNKQNKESLIYNQQEQIIQEEDLIQLVHTFLPKRKKRVVSILRQKGCFLSYQNPRFIFEGVEKLWMNAKKQYGHINSLYNISCQQLGFNPRNQLHVGQLKGNFSGSCFNLFARKSRQESAEMIATIIYQTGCSQSRNMTVYVKSEQHPYQELQGAESQADLRELFEKGQNANLGKIVKLINKQPTWNEKNICYCLNFRGKSRLPSVKNMILIKEQSPSQESLLFCKTDSNTFHLELSDPLSPFIAFGIVLSSFDYKLLCQ